MPRICYFLGISIYMYWRDHPPPHFHAIYGDYAAQFAIETGEILEGKFPRKATQLVKEWIELYRAELLEAWNLAQAERELSKIPPLE